MKCLLANQRQHSFQRSPPAAKEDERGSVCFDLRLRVSMYQHQYRPHCLVCAGGRRREAARETAHRRPRLGLAHFKRRQAMSGHALGHSQNDHAGMIYLFSRCSGVVDMSAVDVDATVEYCMDMMMSLFIRQ